MTDQYLGEIRIFGFNFAPTGWATCDGQILSIQQNTALFSLLGTNFGGNGTSNFGLPNFQGNTGVHQGQGAGLSQYFVGEQTGSPQVTLLANQLPSHTHTINTLNAGLSSQLLHAPTNAAYLGTSTPDKIYFQVNPTQTMAPQAIGPSAGGSNPHENRQPYLVLIFCIALQGAYPARN
jgi:microcystin-dependent protein